MSDIEEIIGSVTDKSLLMTFATLTHRLHVADRTPGQEANALDLRAQRNRVEGEILRRMDDGDEIPIRVVTKTNPSGEVRQCDRRDLHGSHEHQAEFGAYFNVYCPGNDGSHP